MMGVLTFNFINMNILLNNINDIKITKDNKKVEYLELPCCFDIETSSFYNEINEKSALMYAWVLAIGSNCIIGRTWEEFELCRYMLVHKYELNIDKRLVIYIHNLSYEFQFFRKRIEWETVFSLEERKPVKALSIDGIEFRCSYLLSGYSLEKLVDQLTKHKINKMVGDLDYNLIRTPTTSLTDKELGYIINDGLIVTYYIEELIERLGSITKIPLTKTGFVRRLCRDSCLYEEGSHKKNPDKYLNYRKFIKGLTLDLSTFKQLQRAFAGGFTHSNVLWSNETVTNVGSFDLTSAYPYQMVAKKFPMSKPFKMKHLDDKRFNYALKKYCCLFDCKFINMNSKILFENYISKSKCWGLKNQIENNGRIVSAEELSISVTEQDFDIIKNTYTWENVEISNFVYFTKGYLPTDLVKTILKLYNDKTQLKGVKGKEVEYLNSKEQVNSVYGMMVTNPCRDEIAYEEEWFKQEPDIEEALNKHNSSVKRFLYYPWGVWVTAYNRHDLWDGILEFQDDYVYSDTDSIKGKNIDDHMEFINNYNDNIIKILEESMNYHNIPIELTRPKTIKGIEKQLGIWEYEETYDRFKTLGAKRYMTEINGKRSLTVSGVNKKFAIPYLEEQYGDNIFDLFNDGLEIPPNYTGKNIHTYIDDKRVGVVKDYKGNLYEYEELSSVHLEATSYSLSLSDTYAKYILGIKDIKL